MITILFRYLGPTQVCLELKHRECTIDLGFKNVFLFTHIIFYLSFEPSAICGMHNKGLLLGFCSLISRCYIPQKGGLYHLK